MKYLILPPCPPPPLSLSLSNSRYYKVLLISLRIWIGIYVVLWWLCQQIHLSWHYESFHMNNATCIFNPLLIYWYYQAFFWFPTLDISGIFKESKVYQYTINDLRSNFKAYQTKGGKLLIRIIMKILNKELNIPYALSFDDHIDKLTFQLQTFFILIFHTILCLTMWNIRYTSPRVVVP